MSLLKLSLALIGSLLFSTAALGQSNTYLVLFKDKPTDVSLNEILSTKSIARRAKFNILLTEEDFPVNPTYIAQVSSVDSTYIRYTLKWHNGVVINSTEASSAAISKLNSVKKVTYVGKSIVSLEPEKPKFYSPTIKMKESSMITQNLNPDDYGVSYTQNKQIQVTQMHKNGFDGTGVSIAVFDAGFNSIDKIPSFLKHQANELLTFGFDVAGLDNVLNLKDNHGTAVTSCIGSYDPGKYIGSAPKAKLILFRTEFASTEYPVEELNWCKAAELADSIGVDMISSSLGYNQYDDKALSYTHKDLDGKTSYASKAAKIASEKAIIVLNSAGNSGDNKWRKIGTPSDASEVLAVGAIDKKGRPGSFSSHGYNAAGDIKPDIAALGVLASVASPSGSYYQGYGTSYATPIAAGGVACLVQAFPNVHPDTLKAAIRKTASHSAQPDSLSGYGTAQLYTAKEYLALKNELEQEARLLSTTQNAINIYTGSANTLEFEVYQDNRIFFIFNSKKKVTEGFIQCSDRFYRIDLSTAPLKCSKKYTVKIAAKSPVDTYLLRSSELYQCLE